MLTGVTRSQLGPVIPAFLAILPAALGVGSGTLLLVLVVPRIVEPEWALSFDCVSALADALAPSQSSRDRSRRAQVDRDGRRHHHPDPLRSFALARIAHPSPRRATGRRSDVGHLAPLGGFARPGRRRRAVVVRHPGDGSLQGDECADRGGGARAA